MKQQFYVAGCVSKSLIVFGMSWDNGRPFFCLMVLIRRKNKNNSTTGICSQSPAPNNWPWGICCSYTQHPQQTHQRFFLNVIKSGQQSARPYEQMILCVLKLLKMWDELCSQWLWEALARHHGLPSQDWINTDDFSAFIQVWTWMRTISPFFLSCFGHASSNPVSEFPRSLPSCYLFTVAASSDVFLTEFIPHLFSAVVVRSHSAITSSHKVSLISPIFIIIKDRRGFSARVCSCLQTEAQEKEIGSSITWWGDFFKIQLLGSFHFRKAADYSSAEMLLIRSVRRSGRGEIFLGFGGFPMSVCSHSEADLYGNALWHRLFSNCSAVKDLSF